MIDFNTLPVARSALAAFAALVVTTTFVAAAVGPARAVETEAPRAAASFAAAPAAVRNG